MGKRSNFERVERDFYPTPAKAVEPLVRHLGRSVTFAEPCAGDGALVRHLEAYGNHCLFASDIEPQYEGAVQMDALELRSRHLNGAEMIITNPPWDRKLLHPMIETFVATTRDVWLLFDADWPHTKQSRDLVDMWCAEIVPIGRVKWIPDSPHTGKDNVCWYRFNWEAKNAIFHSRRN